MEAAYKTLDKLAKFSGSISFVAFVGMMLLIVVDVLLRFFLNSPILGSYEIVEQLMFCGVFASFAYGQMTGSHIHITLFVMKVPQKIGLFLYGLGELLSAAIVFVLCYAAIEQAKLASLQSYTTLILEIPTTPFFWIEVIASAILALTILYNSIKYFTGVFNEEIGNQLSSQWV